MRKKRKKKGEKEKKDDDWTIKMSLFFFVSERRNFCLLFDSQEFKLNELYRSERNSFFLSRGEEEEKEGEGIKIERERERREEEEELVMRYPQVIPGQSIKGIKSREKRYQKYQGGESIRKVSERKKKRERKRKRERKKKREFELQQIESLFA